MFIMPSFKKSLIVEQFQGNYLKLENLLRWPFFFTLTDLAAPFRTLGWPSVEKQRQQMIKLRIRAAQKSFFLSQDEQIC